MGHSFSRFGSDLGIWFSKQKEKKVFNDIHDNPVCKFCKLETIRFIYWLEFTK